MQELLDLCGNQDHYMFFSLSLSLCSIISYRDCCNIILCEVQKVISRNGETDLKNHVQSYPGDQKGCRDQFGYADLPSLYPLHIIK